MESVLKLFQRVSTAVVKEDKSHDNLLEEIREVSRQIAYNECWFQNECDSDLIDACVFQREALRARYRYLLNLARNRGINSPTYQF